MSKLPEVVLIGSFSIDRIMNFAGFYKDLIQPDKIHVLSLSILIDKLSHTRGGVAANIAYNLVQLGDHPALLTSVGPDSADYLAHLNSLGIDISRVHESSLPTSTFTVMTDSADNQIGGFYPGAMSDSASLNLAPWDHTKAIIVVSAYDPGTMNRLVGESADRQLRLVYDIGQQVSNVSAENLLEGINKAEVVIVNDYELGVLCKRTGLTAVALILQIPILITTLGAEGSRIQGTRVTGTIEVRAVKSITVVDPTGAGDAYRAGFLYGFRRGWEVERCCELASIVASFAVEQHGTQEHAFTLAQIADRYYSTYGKQIKL